MSDLVLNRPLSVRNRIFDFQNPFKSGCDILTDSAKNELLAEQQVLPGTQLHQSGYDGIFNFLFTCCPSESGEDLTDEDRKQFAETTIKKFKAAFAELNTTELTIFNSDQSDPTKTNASTSKLEIDCASLIIWHDFHSRSQVLLNKKTLPSTHHLFKSTTLSDTYPLDDLDYLGVFTALALFSDAEQAFKEGVSESVVCSLVTLGYSVVQKLLNQADTYEIGRLANARQFKKKSGARMQKRTEKYQELYNLFMICFIQKVNNFYHTNGHVNNIWKSKASCVREILQLDKMHRCQNEDLLKKAKEIRQEIAPDTFDFPTNRTFDEHLTSQLPSIPDSELFFSRKKPTK